MACMYIHGRFVCMYVFMYGWMDGWMDMCKYVSMYICMQRTWLACGTAEQGACVCVCGRIGSGGDDAGHAICCQRVAQKNSGPPVVACASAPSRIIWSRTFVAHTFVTLTHTERALDRPAPSFFARLLPHLLLLHKAASNSSLLSLLLPQAHTAPSPYTRCIHHQSLPAPRRAPPRPVFLWRAAVVLRASLSTPRLVPAGTLCKTRAPTHPPVSTHHQCHRLPSAKPRRQPTWRHS